ncbi:MAG: N-6 DNA methylase, partial [Polyangiaceae bacterium]|nr:N-6 DNA methylase [Polyangiaceae bacterium]
MKRRRSIRRAEAQLGFDALHIEGGLLSPEWLTKVAQLSAGHQSEADYRIEKGLRLRDEIGRFWRIAQAYWQEFAAGRLRSMDPRGLAEHFVTSLLRKSFAFESLRPVPPVSLGDRTFPIGHAALDGRVPVVIAPAGIGLDRLPESAGEGGRRRSAFGLAQEYLNAQEGALWGIVSDGCTLRILRDNASLTRPAWIEADLERIFTEERYADFAALWLLLHETRFGKPGQPVTDCALETWRDAGREEGIRAREFLRRGVEEALLALGQGFLSHPANQALRGALQDGSLSTRDLFQQLLRLIYRMIFLLTIEERGLLHPEGVPEAARRLYEEGYGLRQLRERAARRSAHDRFSDRWEALKIVFRGLARGEPRLGLPALAGLFAPHQCAALDTARLENRALMLAMFRLSWLRSDSGLARVNWRDMGPEELGSVYESLLELVPQITDQGRRFTFATGDESRGHARKTTGSYYTPDSLVQVLLDSALEPVVADTLAAHPADPVEALLSLAVVDPACGSGHFLLAAARRLAVHVARLRASGTPSASEYRRALRDVVRRCIHGVDLNPMAVELCKVSLWMEALEPGLPLT